MPRLAIAAAAVLTGASLAACGTTKIRHVTTTITRPVASATSSATTTTTTASTPSTTTQSSTGSPRPASSVAGRAPKAVLAAAAAALRRSGNYAMRADLHQDGGPVVIALTAAGNQTFDASVTQGRQHNEIISLPGASYLRGNAAFWTGQAGGSAAGRARARRLASHWVQVPRRDRRSVIRSLGSLAPGTLATCLTEDHGTLRVSGHATIAHRRAVLVHDAGDAPGATPSTIAVAATGTPYPLRYVATGRSRRGGRVDACNDGKGDDVTGTITFGQFGTVPQIQAPEGASPGGGSAA